MKSYNLTLVTSSSWAIIIYPLLSEGLSKSPLMSVCSINAKHTIMLKTIIYNLILQSLFYNSFYISFMVSEHLLVPIPLIFLSICSVLDKWPTHLHFASVMHHITSVIVWSLLHFIIFINLLCLTIFSTYFSVLCSFCIILIVSVHVSNLYIIAGLTKCLPIHIYRQLVQH